MTQTERPMRSCADSASPSRRFGRTSTAQRRRSPDSRVHVRQASAVEAGGQPPVGGGFGMVDVGVGTGRELLGALRGEIRDLCGSAQDAASGLALGSYTPSP